MREKVLKISYEIMWYIFEIKLLTKFDKIKINIVENNIGLDSLYKYN